MGGKFTMSDDSHGIAQVATNYAGGLSYLKSLGVKEVWTFGRKPTGETEGFAKAVLEDVKVTLEDFKITQQGA